MGDEPHLIGAAHGLGARARVELGQDGGDMMLDGLRRGREPLGDLGVAQSFGQQQQDLELARGEASGVRLGGGTGTTRQPTDTGGAQPPARDLGGGRRA